MCRDWGGAICRGSEEFTGLSSQVTPTAHSSLLLTAPHHPSVSCTGSGLRQTRGLVLGWEDISIGVGSWTAREVGAQTPETRGPCQRLTAGARPWGSCLWVPCSFVAPAEAVCSSGTRTAPRTRPRSPGYPKHSG